MSGPELAAPLGTLLLLPPISAKPESSTRAPSGTQIVEPPMTAIAVTVASPSGKLAARRSRSLPPMKSTIIVSSVATSSARSLPPMTETSQRRFRGCALDAGASGRSAVSTSSSSCVRAS